MLAADASASGVVNQISPLGGNVRASIPVLEHKIRLLDSWGRGVIDGGGLRYHHDRLMPGYMTQDLSQVFPRLHWGEYEFFYAGDVMRYQIFFHNKTSRSYRNLKISAWQEHLRPDGSWQPMEGTDDAREWTVSGLTAGEMLVLNGDVAVPVAQMRLGLTRTRYQVEYIDDGRSDQLVPRLLMENEITSIWCPSEFKPR